MAGAFQYRPRFVDIRVRPPTAEEAAQADVHALKPGQRACDHPGCRVAASAKAPKSRDMLNEHYWFCQPHAADYNRNWNFFAGMSESEVRARMEQSALGDRPTWDFKAGKNSRESAAAARGFATGDGFRDPFDLFGRTSASRASEAPARRNLGKLERTALADLDLDEEADAARIRARYTELVKLCHPDANGGDRSAEAKLQRTIRAYQVLRKAKVV